MTSRIVTAAVAFGCVAAAGLGGYLAVRTATETSAAAPAHLVDAPTAHSPSTPAPAPETIVPSPAHPPAAVTPRAPRRASEPAPSQVVDRQAPIRHNTASRPSVPSESQTTARAEAEAFPAPAMPSVPAPDITAGFSTPAAIYQPTAAAPALLFDEIELPSNTVIGIRLDSTVSSETARVEDRIRARVTRAVIIDGETIIPSGADVNGVVSFVEPGGKIRERARIGIQFTSIRLNDGLTVPVQTETIYREGDPPAGEATAKIGTSAIVGSILGGVFGGKKGAAIGGAAGAAGGTAIVVAGDRNPAVLSAGTSLTVRLSEAAVFEVERSR